MTSTITGYIAGTWDIDPIHSDVSFVVRHLGLTRYRRSFERFSGEIVTAADPLGSTFHAEIDTASFDTGLESFNRHLLGGEFFDVENHPTATLRSTGLREHGEHYLLDADLTLRGVTKAITLDLELLGFGVGLDGTPKAAFSASTTISRADFGIVFQSKLANGNLAVGDEVRVLVEIEAVHREAA
ncbi:YceI family protein [Actinokineospora auranticolor]|uniref:Polyisoprenoid-binding protein YceI n=1 Tax=Actinokineospora auranticolor TaxID=155976 RepID=A0A2S6GFQ2_9PSEU|nr:YceI family protein [Actinokineospora auranticolor]PPK64049.1 polyisoprenoid-binding protein YceI [Actinokineospora auranticolor]